MPLPDAQTVIRLHDDCLAREGWPGAVDPGLAPQGQDDAPAEAAWHWIVLNHLNNSRLWAEEDLARRTRVADAEIAANKRHIDAFNQARNDATERVDECLLLALGLVDEASARSDTPVSRAPAGARLNSETAGSMIDRMSILALKIHAMRQQTVREDVDEAHRLSSRVKLERLEQQRGDLGGCLDTLLADSATGRACFKVYRQFKMYNDARFNPALVAERRSAGA
jgi:hypothetical protein